MRKTNTTSKDQTLRQKAENLLKNRYSKKPEQYTEDEIHNLVHELEVHQIELEMQNEELVRAKENAEIAFEKYMELYDFAPSGYFTLSNAGKIIELNLQLAKMIGKERSRLINNQFGFFISEDTKLIFNNFIETIFISRTKQTCEVSLIAINLLNIPVYLTGVISKNQEQCFITLIDITERKRVEKQLLETNAYLENLINYSNAPIIIWNPEFKITRFNHAFESLTGHRENEVLGQSLEILFPLDQVENSMELIHKTKSGERWKTVEIEIIHKDQSKRTLLWNSATILNQESNIAIATFAQGVDITILKKTIDALKESEKYLDNIINNMGNPFFVKDDQCKIITANDAFCKMFKLSKDNIIGKTLTEKVAEEERETFMKIDKQLLEDGLENINEGSLTLKGESPLTISTRKTLFIDANGKKFIIGMIYEITERKKMEEALRESEYFLKDAQAIAQLGAYSMEIDSGKWSSSEVLDTLFGIDANFDKSFEGWINIVHPEWKQTLKNYFNTEVISKKVPFDKEYKIIRQNDKKVRWVHGLGKLIFNEKNEPVKMIGTIQDITQRQKNEEVLLQLSQAVEQSPVTIVITDITGAIQYVNPKFVETTGYNFEEVIGKNSRVLKSGHTSSGEYKVLWKTISEGKEWHGEFHNKRKDGTLYWESSSISPIINTKGETTHFIAIKEDITERKRQQEELIIANKELAFHNEEKGKRAKELIKANKELAFQNEEKEKRADELILANKELAFQNEEKEKRADELILANKELAFQNEEKGKRAKELIKAKDHAEESDRLKSSFLANMSHEIRTPMNGILGFTELLKEPGLTGEDQQEYIRIIQESGDRMLNIINDIIDISKIESKQMKVSYSETNINEKMDYIFNFFKPEVSNKGIELVYKNSLAEQESVIITDSEKVYAILINLVKNAIKFTDKGRIEFGYQLKKEDNSPKLEFFIKDSGVGIPKNKQQAIFNRFVQASISDKRAFEGAGLGLSISKAYVEMLGGKIWLESKEGKGSTFYFTIPYKTKLKKDTEIINIPSETKIENQVRDLKILIVEDDKISNLLISKAVKIFSKEVLKAATGIEAIEACRNNPDIDLVMMDVNMPLMNGYDATREIRKFNKEVIIIAQTAYGMISDREEALAAGCNDYISKPINIAVLCGLIQKYFKKELEV